MPQPVERQYTLQDIQQLPAGSRAELISGKLYMLAAPSEIHQRISMGLSITIGTYIKSTGGKCRSYAAPFAVFPFANDTTYLEPDLSVICDPDKIGPDGCHGAPDWVIEIASLTTAKLDMGKKRQIYEKAGVREYWVILPDSQLVLAFIFEDESKTNIYPFNNEIPVAIYPGLSIRVSELLS